MKRIVICLISFMLLVAACQSQTNAAAMPTPASSVVENFVWQTDGPCGYRMMRPEDWEASQVECRFYTFPGGQNGKDRLVLRVANYQLLARRMSSGILAQYELFKRNPSLESWTQAIEQNWESNGIQFTRLDVLQEARVYWVQSPGSPDVEIAAFTIDDNQPLGLGLTASGIYADTESLQREGILDDFLAVAASIQAIPENPENIEPPLK